MADAIPDKLVHLPIADVDAKILGRPFKGRDTITAARFAKKDGDAAGGLALLSILLEVGGRQQVYEDLLDMDTRDLDAIWSALIGDPRFPRLTAEMATERPSS
jgi:hypothetical protein